MHGKWFAGSALATAAALAFALPVRAGDTHRLSMPSRTAGAPTLSLVDHGEGADAVSVHGRGGYYGGYRGGYGGYRGGYGGYRGGYGGYRGGYGGYRGGYGGYRGGYGGYRGYGYSRGYYGGFGYYPYYARRYYGFGYYPSYSFGSYYQPYYYSTPSVYYYSTPSYSFSAPLCPSSGAPSRVLSLTITGVAKNPMRNEELLGAPAPVQPDDQTFPYDGGPRNPAPMPKAEPMPSAPPVDDHSVSLPAKVASKLVYPAYGEQMVLPAAPRYQDRGVLVKGEPVKKLTK